MQFKNIGNKSSFESIACIHHALFILLLEICLIVIKYSCFTTFSLKNETLKAYINLLSTNNVNNLDVCP